jgi:vacuolar-type H+-ATPase subunit I/STV1
MKQSTFVKWGLLSFGLVLLTFVIRGSTRLFLGDRIAAILSAPIAAGALVLLVVLFATAVLSVTGIRPMERDIDER